MQGRNFYAVLWIFGVELALILMILWSVILDVEDKFYIYTPKVEVYVTRFLCTFLLHMELTEDIKQGMNMIYYLNTHPDKFTETLTPFLIGSL